MIFLAVTYHKTNSLIIDTGFMTYLCYSLNKFDFQALITHIR